MLPDMFMGAIFGIINGPLSFAIGIACGRLMEGFGSVAATLTLIAMIASIAFVSGAGLGFSVGGFASTDALAIALGLGGSPLLASLPFLFLELGGQSLFIAAVIFALGLVQAPGGYIGCTRSQPPKPQPQLGIGHSCAACQYDLTATPDHHPCPECGTMFRLASTQPASTARGVP